MEQGREAVPPSGRQAPILEMRGISKTFPGVKALNNVQLTPGGGEVHALMGENGAGKSTLMKILSGAYQADPGGDITVDGRAGRHTVRCGHASRHRHHLPGTGAGAQPDGGREHVSRSRAAPGRHDRPGDDVRDRAAVLERLGATVPPRTLVARCRSPSARWSRSRARCMRTPASWCWTSRRPRCRRGRPSGCSRSSAAPRGRLALVYISHRMAEVYELLGPRIDAARRQLRRHARRATR